MTLESDVLSSFLLHSTVCHGKHLFRAAFPANVHLYKGVDTMMSTLAVARYSPARWNGPASFRTAARTFSAWAVSKMPVAQTADDRTPSCAQVIERFTTSCLSVLMGSKCLAHLTFPEKMRLSAFHVAGRFSDWTPSMRTATVTLDALLLYTWYSKPALHGTP